jgi:hypothetical protein
MSQYTGLRGWYSGARCGTEGTVTGTRVVGIGDMVLGAKGSTPWG